MEPNTDNNGHPEPKGVMKVPFYRAPIPPVLLVLLGVVIVVVIGIGIGISNYYENQRKEKIASGEKAKEDKKFKEILRENDYDICKSEAYLSYLTNWRNDCRDLGEKPDCRLPLALAERWDRLHKEEKEKCEKKYLQNQ